jgi:hypothetical protein
MEPTPTYVNREPLLLNAGAARTLVLALAVLAGWAPAFADSTHPKLDPAVRLALDSSGGAVPVIVTARAGQTPACSLVWSPSPARSNTS